jgi:hypothetical protein
LSTIPLHQICIKKDRVIMKKGTEFMCDLQSEDAYQMDRICFNCSRFFPCAEDVESEKGICLEDPELEPFLDQILEENPDAECKKLISHKSFSGEKEACDSFEPAEIIELDDDLDLELIEEIKSLSKNNGKIDAEELEALLIRKKVATYLQTMPVGPEVAMFKNGTTQQRQQAFNNLIGAASFGNREAWLAMLEILQFLPPPQTVEEVKFKVDLLKRINGRVAKEVLIPILIDDMYQTQSNNVTRKWFTAIFRFLESCPFEAICEPLEGMLRDKRFSYRLKGRIREVLTIADMPRGRFW